MQNRKTLTDSISPDAVAFLNDGRADIKKATSTRKAVELQEQKINIPELQKKMFTCTLPVHLVNELVMVSTQRRISGQKPSTQGAIIELALQDWLKNNK